MLRCWSAHRRWSFQLIIRRLRGASADCKHYETESDHRAKVVFCVTNRTCRKTFQVLPVGCPHNGRGCQKTKIKHPPQEIPFNCMCGSENQFLECPWLPTARLFIILISMQVNMQRSILFGNNWLGKSPRNTTVDYIE